jgi:acetone carboxylase gamma subunit
LLELLQYKQEHGNTLVPKTENNKQLGIWVGTQRIKYHNNKLLPERVEKLDEIGFVWDVPEAQWLHYFEQLCQYKAEHGNTLVPQRYEDNPSLGKWVDTQRSNHHANTLSSERIEKLNEVGFVWDVLEAQWSEYFEQLCRYKKEHENTLVPQRYEDNPSLGKWVNSQRSNYNANKLSPQRIENLNEISICLGLY